jgi:hypothetical protein
LKEEEFMTLLDDTSIEARDEVVGKIFFLEVEASSFMRIAHQ